MSQLPKKCQIVEITEKLGIHNAVMYNIEYSQYKSHWSNKVSPVLNKSL